MPYTKKESQREYDKLRWQKMKNDPDAQEKARERKREARQRSKDYVIAWKRQGCKHCDEQEPVVLAAHHRDPSQKESTINRMIANRSGPETLQRELDKCDCVCANCHLKIHAGLIT